jgi:hypothetical protein
MNKKDEALQMAIEALEYESFCPDFLRDEAINACKEALEQQEGKEFFERGKEIARWADKNFNGKEKMINQFKRKFLGRQNMNKLILSLSLVFIGMYIGFIIAMVLGLV